MLVILSGAEVIFQASVENENIWPAIETFIETFSDKHVREDYTEREKSDRSDSEAVKPLLRQLRFHKCFVTISDKALSPPPPPWYSYR